MAEVNKWMIDPKDAVMLLIDHQSGLFQLVRDIDLPTLRAHVTALAKVAHLAKIPTFTTASVPDGHSGTRSARDSLARWATGMSTTRRSISSDVSALATSAPGLSPLTTATRSRPCGANCVSG
jgi:nicotinamidase-related amidase